MFNSCTSALMQLILQYGVHLGDAGGFGPRDEIGYFLARSEYGKAKRKRTALLGAPHAKGYIAALQCTQVQQAYVDSVRKHLVAEATKRDVRFVLVSTFMAYTNNCLFGGTLCAIKKICDEVGALLILDETLGSLRLGPLCSYTLAKGFKPHAFLLGSKTFMVASLWVLPSLKKQFDKMLPNLAGMHITRGTLDLFEKIVRYICTINISKRVEEGEALRKHLGIDGGGLFWWVSKPPKSNKLQELIMPALNTFRFKNRILIPLDFKFGPFTKQLKLLRKDEKKRKLQREKGKDWQAESRARKKARVRQEVLVKLVDLPEDLALSLLALKDNRHREVSIVGSDPVAAVGNKTGRQMRRWPNALDACKAVLKAFGMKRQKIMTPIRLWNLPNAPPTPQALHVDGACSILVPVARDGRNVDFLALHEEKFVRVQVHIPFGKAILFNGCVFHGGAAGIRGIENAAIHFNIEMDGNGETFQYWFLSKFNRVEAKPFFKPGIVKSDGTIDKKCLAEYGCPKLEMFKGLMVGWYPECAEWDGVELQSQTPFDICDMETYMKNHHVAERSGSSRKQLALMQTNRSSGSST